MQDNIKNINIHKLAENTVNISQDTFWIKPKVVKCRLREGNILLQAKNTKFYLISDPIPPNG
jgi:hypothetical protein